VDGSDDHRVIGKTITRLQTLSLVHSESKSVGFLNTSRTDRNGIAIRHTPTDRIGSQVSVTHLVIINLGIPDPSSPDSMRSTIASEEHRLISLDTSNNSLFERLGRGIDICAAGA
jgi:hypothetical protein